MVYEQTDTPEAFDFFGLRVDRTDKALILALVDDCIRAGPTRIVFGWSITVIPKLRTLPQIACLGNRFDLLLADGRGLYWLCNLMGAHLTQHISIPDLAEIVLAHASLRGYSVFLLGATAETNKLAVESVRERFPGIARVDGRDGYFDDGDAPEVIAEIEKNAPDILLVGISSPRKEELASALRPLLGASVIVPCGGVIDILGGKTSREPRIIQRLALAWIYRVLLEPRRLFRPVLLNGLEFIFLVLPSVVFHRWILGDRGYTFLRHYGHIIKHVRA